MDEQIPLFEVVTQEEFNKSTPRARGYKTEPRTLAVWFALPHTRGFCTVPRHEEIQEMLEPGQKEYRQKYPTRMLFQIGDLFVCRDCFTSEADKSDD